MINLFISILLILNIEKYPILAHEIFLDHIESYYGNYSFLFKTQNQIFSSEYIKDHKIKQIYVCCKFYNRIFFKYLCNYSKEGALKKIILLDSNYNLGDNVRSFTLRSIKISHKKLIKHYSDSFIRIEYDFYSKEIIINDRDRYYSTKYNYREPLFGNNPLSKRTYFNEDYKLIKETILNTQDSINCENLYFNNHLIETKVNSYFLFNLQKTGNKSSIISNNESFMYSYSQENMLTEIRKKESSIITNEFIKIDYKIRH